MKVRVRQRESVLDELEVIRGEITERAFDLFSRRGGALGRALEDWLAAEREVLWKPAVEVTERDGAFLVEAAIAGVEVRQLVIQVTPDALLIRGETAHRHAPDEKVLLCEFRAGKLFREIDFPRRVDPEKVHADYRDGLLRVRALVAKEAAARKVA